MPPKSLSMKSRVYCGLLCPHRCPTTCLVLCSMYSSKSASH
jgi:hypothetical protein